MSDPTDPLPPGSPDPTPPTAPSTPVAPPTRTWRERLGTPGARVALITTGVIASLLVIGLVVGGSVALARAAWHDHDRGPGISRMDRGSRMEHGPQMGPGQQGPRSRMGPGQQQGPGQGTPPWTGGDNSRQGPFGQQSTGPRGMTPGAGIADFLPGGLVLHGEFTTSMTGTPTAMLIQTGEVTAASATSLSVRSSDGFTADYVVDTATTIRRGNPAKVGDTVMVIAAKDGARATIVQPLGGATTP